MKESNTGLLTVRQFAEAAGTTSRTLKYYEEIGIFQPFYVDQDNEYRYYSMYQLNDIEAIQVLKQCGMKLSEIRSYLKKPSYERRLEILQLQEKSLREQIEKSIRIQKLISLERCMMRHAAERGYKGLHFIDIPLISYDLFPFTDNEWAVTVQTFDNYSVNGVYYSEDNKHGIFRLNVSSREGTEYFRGGEFVVYYYKSHPKEYPKYVPQMEKELQKEKLKRISPLFNSALYEDTNDNYVSFILTYVSR